METILTVYFTIAGFVLFTTAIASCDGMSPDEVENFWDWLAYGLLWILLVVKGLVVVIKRLLK